MLTFKKEIFRANELCKELGIARSTFYKYQQEWVVVRKGDLSEMGKFTLKGSKRTYWIIKKFMAWLIKYKVNEKATFNYEVADQRNAEKYLITLTEKHNANR